jgi:hypothetical protein
MFKYLNNVLTYTEERIVSNETIITLITDLTKDVDIFGELSFENGTSIIIKFFYYKDNVFKSKLNLTNQSKQFLPSSKFKLIIFDTGNHKTTNYVQLKFDLERLTFNSNKTSSEEIKDLYLKVASLESKLNHLIDGHIIDSLPINNKEYIKAGMMLQAIDDNGNFIATYPFADVVKDVNGVKAVNSSIILDASMIQYNQNKTIFSVVSEVIEALQAVNLTLKSHSSALKQLQEDINGVKLQLEKHLNDGIV